MTDIKKGGNKLKYYRKKSGLSQKELAEKSGVSRQYISELENGKRNINKIYSETAAKISDALGVKTEDILE